MVIAATSYNPRDQMTKAIKYVSQVASASVEYKYCLTCDSVLSERIERNSANAIVSHRRYDKNGMDPVSEHGMTIVLSYRRRPVSTATGGCTVTRRAGAVV